jgi:hypothetical protein
MLSRHSKATRASARPCCCDFRYTFLAVRAARAREFCIMPLWLFCGCYTSKACLIREGTSHDSIGRRPSVGPGRLPSSLSSRHCSERQDLADFVSLMGTMVTKST